MAFLIMAKLSVCCCDGNVKGARSGEQGAQAAWAARSVATAPAPQHRPKAARWSALSDLERPTRRSSDSPQDEACKAHFLRLVHRDSSGGNEGELRAGHAPLCRSNNARGGNRAG